MRRIISILLCLASIAGAYAQTFVIDQLKYTVTGQDKVSVSANDKTISGDLTIPSSVTYQGTDYTVNSLGGYAFSSCANLTSVNIPNSVTVIGNSAFYQCTSLTSVSIPNSVTVIGNSAFFGCYSLTEITVSASNNYFCSVDGILFNGDRTSLIQYPAGKSNQEYSIPNSVTEIGNYAFYLCDNLTSVGIPNSVTVIGNYAFCGCTSLTSVSIPNSVTEIGDSAFFRCSNLTEITVSASNNYFCSVDGILFNGDRTSLIQYPAGKSNQEYSIPNSVTVIGNYAFYLCDNLTSVSIPNSVTVIGDSAFSGCTNLTSVSIPNSVTEIGYSAFRGCTSLTSVSIPNSVTVIRNNTFQGCTNLTSVNIPNSVTEIGLCAFYKCTNLASVNIPNSVTTLVNRAFCECTSLKSVNIPSSVTEIISGGIFAECTSLNEITVSTDNNYFCSVDGILFNKDKTTLIQYPAGKSNQEYTIPNSVTNIWFYAFGGCHNLINICIPNYATIDDIWCFKQCTNLSTVTIGKAVNDLYHAFPGCTSLKEIYCLPSTPPTYPRFEDEVFAQATLYVPVESKGVYASTEPWCKFQNIVATDFSGVENTSNDPNITIKVENGQLIVTGLGDNELITIYNMAGALVYYGAGHTVSSLAHGMYIVKAGTVVTKVAI